MARIDRQRLDAGVFPVTVDIHTRFGDLDLQGHVNNAAAAALLQEARAHFNRTAGLPELRDGLRTMVAATTIEFAGEMRYPEPVEVRTGVLAIGRTSMTFAQVARQDGRSTLYVQTVMVMTDAGGTPAPIPEALRAAYERLLIRNG